LIDHLVSYHCPATYKADLEGLLNEIIILSDIAELAVEADREFLSEASAEKEEPLSRPSLSRIRWKSLRFNGRGRPLDDSGNGTTDAEDNGSAGGDEGNTNGISATHSLPGQSGQLKRQVSDIKNQLDRWEEPIDKSFEVSSSRLGIGKIEIVLFIPHSFV
jgi:hypothetical protein